MKLLGTVLLVGLLVGSAWAGTIGVTVDPVYQAVHISAGTAQINILADIAEEDAIIGFGIDLGLGGDMNVSYTAADVTIGPLFDAAYAPDGDALAGLVEPPGVVWGDDVLLATITLHLNALGTTTLNPGDSNPYPGQGPDLTEGFIGEGGWLMVSYTPGSIYVFPEPTSLLLLSGLLLLRRR